VWDKEVTVDPVSKQPADPLRPPDWRWRLALESAEDPGRPVRRCPDDAVRAGKRFWRLWSACRGEADHRVLAERMPTVYHAFGVHSDPGGATRAALEARILACEAPEVVAGKAAMAAAVVRLYELLFFDVRDRLESPDYILNQVLGPRLQGGGDWDFDLVWKFFGYVGGPHILDLVMDTDRGPRPATAQEAAAFLSEDARAALQRQLAVAARALRAGAWREAAALVRACARPSGGREDEAIPNGLLQNINAMLQALPWAVGRDAAKDLPPALAEYEETAAELRADEQFLLGTRQEVAGLAEIKGWKYPPEGRPGS
jgi:hypothetical protein